MPCGICLFLCYPLTLFSFSLSDVMADHSERFLNQHRPKIIQRTRNPIGLADALLAAHCVGKEMYEKIRKEKLAADQMREIYKYLTLKKHFDCTHVWLKENEPDLLEDLGKPLPVTEIINHKKKQLCEIQYELLFSVKKKICCKFYKIAQVLLS